MTRDTGIAHATKLPFLAPILFRGPDAVGFLQGQLTNDVQLLADGRTQLAACITPQGRVIALLRLHQTGQDTAPDIVALLPAELAQPVMDRLRKFVLRARVEILSPADWRCVLAPADAALAEPPATRMAGPSSLVFDFGGGRRVLAGPTSALSASTDVTDTGAARGDRIEERWAAAGIAAGLPEVSTATTGSFVPQMLNLDLLAGISFSKGCYTGQEIVARTQNLGRIKRRCFRYRVAADAALPALQGLHKDGTKVGEILMSTPVDDGVELLAVVSLDARDLPLRTESGHTAMPLAVPYTV
jgi:folate-binding protein YgfZ